jgi:ketosteroid isomerase-like protein
VNDSLEEFWEVYSERYMASDLDAVSALYEAPFLAVRENEPIHLPDRDAVREHLAGLMEAYRNASATSAAIADLRVAELDDVSSITTVRWNALSEDGSLLRDFTVSYQLLRTPDGWKILSYTYHSN